MDQRNCIKFCIQNEIKYARICEMLTVALGESTMSRTQVQLWYNRFKEVRENVNDEQGFKNYLQVTLIITQPRLQ